MKPYCADCGEKLDESETNCPGCDAVLHDGEPVVSYIGSALLYVLAIIAITPMEGYTIWVATGIAYAVTATVTLPPVKLYLRTEHGYNITRGLSWLISIVGFGVGLALMP